MKYKEVLKYILNIPMFQNVGQSAYNPSLEKILHLCDFLGNPQNSFKTIHVAGTNGKGSSSAMLCSILQHHGLKVGLYTSPHLIDYRERITINSEMVSETSIEKFMSIAFGEIDKIKPSFFEFTTALAFWVFREQKVDIAIIETGLGGRIDSTNIISPLVSLITNISIDHKAILGDTIEAISREKAGIIKPNTPVVISEVLSENRALFEQKAKEQNSEIFFAQQQFNVIESGYKDAKQFIEIERLCNKKIEKYTLAMLGGYQIKNLLGVLSVIDVLNKYYNYKILNSTTTKAIDNCSVTGRWQVLSQTPYTVCDVGHNYNGISEVVKMINHCQYDTLYIVLGFMQDKEVNDILPLLPKNAKYIATQASNSRSMDSNQLHLLLKDNGFDANNIPKVYEAVKFATSLASKNDMIFIGGSSFIVADYLSHS